MTFHILVSSVSSLSNATSNGWLIIAVGCWVCQKSRSGSRIGSKTDESPIQYSRLPTSWLMALCYNSLDKLRINTLPSSGNSIIKYKLLYTTDWGDIISMPLRWKSCGQLIGSTPYAILKYFWKRKLPVTNIAVQIKKRIQDSRSVHELSIIFQIIKHVLPDRMHFLLMRWEI